jgi:hypothetical protein
MGVSKTKATVQAVAGQSRRWKALELAAIAAVAIFWLIPSVRSGGEPEEPNFPANGPAEFLYLDSDRVIAYLAQFNGGIFTSEQLTHKLTQAENGKASLGGVLELEGGSSQEEMVARQITPTAAANYIDLLAKLEDLREGLKTVGLGRFDRDIHGLTEGQFVVFRTHSLRPPAYLNPYLALRQKKTISTLFPMPLDDGSGRLETRRDRARAQEFRGQVGQNPRVVFALRPLSKRELAAERAGREPRATSSSEREGPAERRRRKREAEKRVQYLMPMDAQLLTQERSLIKFGGGEFTVVGKIVRIFPGPGSDNLPAYVDSPTVETWAQPLAEAPLKLLCRTDPECTVKVRAEGVTEGEREAAIHESRRRAIGALEEQTEIPKRGAVILPIAIYK